MLYRDEYYNPIGGNMADIIVRKNRMGSTGEFQLEFNGSISKFSEISDDTFAFIYEDKDSGPF
jgi:replicative DNA helicase